MKTSPHSGPASDVGLERAPLAATAPAARVATAVLLAATAVGGVAAVGPLLGVRVPPVAQVIIAVGAVAVEATPAHALLLTATAGLLSLAAINKVYVVYHLALVGLLFVARKRTLATAVALFGLAIWLPKHLFREHYLQPGLYNWINEPSLALAIFVTIIWWRERRDGRLPAAAESAPLPLWAVLYFFPGHAINPMVYSPRDLFRERKLDASAVLTGLLLVTVKALAHAALARWLPAVSYGALDGARAAAASRAELWGIVLVGYVNLVLVLSGTADLAILVARLYGFPLASPFRWALLAWNPAELWRRWGLYNRKWLLQVVYFPLGGGARRKYLNVLCTFLASALVLHTGWFGSKYWEVGPGGWRDESVYFLMQGALVCGWLLWNERHGRKAAPSDHVLRLSWARVAGTAATQAASALVHVVVLAQAIPFADRWWVMARCLGLR